MDEDVTLVVRIRPAAQGRPWRASLQDPGDGAPREFESPLALARYLERIAALAPEQGLR